MILIKTTRWFLSGQFKKILKSRNSKILLNSGSMMIYILAWGINVLAAE